MGTVLLLVALLLILLYLLLVHYCPTSYYRKFLILSGLILILVFGLRNGEVNYGSDLNSYYRFYLRAVQSSDFIGFYRDNNMDVGYAFLNWILARIIKNPQFILFAQAFICFGLTLRFIYRYSKDILLSMLGFMAFGLCQFYATGFRQAIAISLCLYAIDFVETRNIKKFVLVIIIAATVHKTAILFLPAYFLVSMPIKTTTILLTVSLTILLATIIPYLFVLGNSVFDRNYTVQFKGNPLGGVVTILCALFTMVPMIRDVDAQKNNLAKTNDVKRVHYEFLLILIFGVGLYAMKFKALIIERVSFYFTPVLFILLPEVLVRYFSSKSWRLLRLAFIVGLLFLIYWRFNVEQYVPIWSN